MTSWSTHVLINNEHLTITQVFIHYPYGAFIYIYGSSEQAKVYIIK